ncbi:MAG: proline racemase family protein [Planctomycetes bacterium]|nr:proline racemase family protein [Planctomycetota bacterium]
MPPPPIAIIDSHTAGEPTRVVVSGGPDLGVGSLAERRKRFQRHFDHYRTAIINEPRGSEVLVGALLCTPCDPTCAAGVIFFNNVGYLGMCGHGTIGVIVTLAHLGRIGAGIHLLETPVGCVSAEYDGGNTVTVANVPSYRHRKDVKVRMDDGSTITGDVAWGGNWFFLLDAHGQSLDRANVDALTHFTWGIRRALQEQAITGVDGAEIDHIELFGPPRDSRNQGRNFVLCPGKAYDRSPCGTGTSAKIACLIADGKLKPGATWRQESILGSVFEASGIVITDAAPVDAGPVVLPSIRGSAHITAEARLVLDEADPFQWGISG